MFRLFTSSSESYSWRRIIKDVLAVVFILLSLEALSRLPFVQSFLAEKLDSYENLLWWDSNMPRYTHDLETDPNYTFWLLGSSYMMTAINPLTVQDSLNESLETDISAQNFGFTLMTNLEVMSRFHETWFLELDQPEIMVLFITENNFSNPSAAAALTGTYERTFLFPNSISEYSGNLLYRSSHLYRYLLLSRNMPLVPYEDTLREPLPLGGYTARQGIYDCSNDNAFQPSPSKFERGIQNIAAFIRVAENHELPLIIINIPYPACTILNSYQDFADYQSNYLSPLRSFVESQNIAFYELDTRFYETVAEEEQAAYFDDAIHTNERGAALFSAWTAEILETWLELHPEYLSESGS